MTTRRPETTPDRVPERATPAGELPPRWGWTEPSVWTERMLKTLETGVRGGKWFSLIDKVYAGANLLAAYERVARNKGAAGVDHIGVEQFGRTAETELGRLQEQLRTGKYRPQAIRRVLIPKVGRPGEHRPLGIPTVRDRVVQTALRNVLEPIFEVGFAEHSYGFRPGRGAKDALRRVWKLIGEGHYWVVDADLKSYFDTIPHEPLLDRVRMRVTDGKVLDLLQMFLTQEVMDSAAGWTPSVGSPQGAVISPLLANIYLDPLDHAVSTAGFEMVRYADDFVILCRTEAEARRALMLVQGLTASAGLTLHPEKTRLVNLDAGESFDFLGYNFAKGRKYLSRRSHERFRERIRELTPRMNGRSERTIIRRLNRTLVGWYGYFKHVNAWMLKRLDGWVRQRIRAILWRRSKRHGYPTQLALRLWPNAFFGRVALFSLAAAHARELQSR